MRLEIAAEPGSMRLTIGIRTLAELGMWPQSSYAVVNDLEAFAASGLVGIHTLRQIRRWGESLRICRLNFDAVCGPFNDLGRARMPRRRC
jgi:hypothetical protein